MITLGGFQPRGLEPASSPVKQEKKKPVSSPMKMRRNLVVESRKSKVERNEGMKRTVRLLPEARSTETGTKAAARGWSINNDDVDTLRDNSGEEKDGTPH